MITKETYHEIFRLVYKDEGDFILNTLKKHLDIKEVKSAGLEFHTTYNNKECEIIDYGYLKDSNGNYTGEIFVDLVCEV